MNKIGKILTMFLIIANVFFIQVYAETYDECVSKCPDASKNPQGNSACVSSCNTQHNKVDNPDDFWEDTKGMRNNFWGKASSWFQKARSSGDDISEYDGVQDVLNEFLDLINVLGTTIIVGVTIILGVKFMLGGIVEKTSAKEGLVTLLVACVFFFGWTSLKNLLYPDNNFIFLKTSDTSVTTPAGRILAYVKFAGNIGAFIAIVAVGVKYIIAGATGKAELKGKSIQFIIGMILTFATVNFLSFISDAVNQAMK